VPEHPTDADQALEPPAHPAALRIQQAERGYLVAITPLSPLNASSAGAFDEG